MMPVSHGSKDMIKGKTKNCHFKIIVSFFSKQKTKISVALLSSFRITSTERVGISKTNPIKELGTATITSHDLTYKDGRRCNGKFFEKF